MAGSVIEQELVRKLTVLGTSMRKHDRGVLMGFLFSLLPIFPLAFVGLGIGLFNRSMYRTGKIDEFDFTMVRRGLIFGAINSALSLLILVVVVQIAWNLQWSQLFESLSHFPQMLVRFLWSLPRSLPATGVTT